MNETCLLNNGIKLQLIYFDLGISSDNRQLTFYLNESLDHLIFPVFRHTVVRRARWKFRPSAKGPYFNYVSMVSKSEQNANLVNRLYLVNMITRVLSWSIIYKNMLYSQCIFESFVNSLQFIYNFFCTDCLQSLYRSK